jgi:glycosyltransferase involved in cell wall biosynthesis
MRVALVHDYLIQFGGAERVLEDVVKIFPHAPVYTLLYDAGATLRRFERCRIKTSFLQRIPLARSRHRFFPFLMPLAAEQFDLSAYDLVISISHSFGKGVLTRPGAVHICYCLTPLRYVWDDSVRYVREFTRASPLRAIVPLFLSYLRVWDTLAATRVDYYIAISRYVADRIAKYYKQSAALVYPPVDVHRFRPRLPRRWKWSFPPGSYFLVVSRMLPYKRVDLAIQACNKLGLPLVIAGTGPDEKRLRKMAGKTVRFLGFVSDAKLPGLYAGARAFIFPQEEDFGITPLEAAAAGVPVVAFRGGGALESIVEGRTGVFFEEQTTESLVDALRRIRQLKFNRREIRRHALRFSRERFREEFSREVERLLKLAREKKEVR